MISTVLFPNNRRERWAFLHTSVSAHEAQIGEVELNTEPPRATRTRQKPSTAQLFELLWENLADLMGTAAVATFVRRALGPAAKRSPDLSSLSILKEELEYTYTLPVSWQAECGGETGRALHDLILELGPLLVQLTGPVAVRRLERITLLKECNILSPEEVSAWLTRK